MTPAIFIVWAGDVGFLACALLIWWRMWRHGVNRPGQIGLALLVAARLAEGLSRLHTGHVPPSPYAWLAGTIFSFVFLYTLYHMGRLLEAARCYAAACRTQKPLQGVQLASHPGRPRIWDM